MMKSNFTGVFFSIFILLSTSCSVSAAPSPMTVIKTSNDDILHLQQTSGPANKAFSQEILLIMEKVTDFDTMANRAVQKICKQGFEEPCIRLKNEFTKLLKLNATRKLGRYRADRFDYLDEQMSSTQAIVKTTAHYKDDSLQLDYILEKKGTHWLIVNYIVDEVDTIQNYRNQFMRITRKHSIEFLINRLQKKNELYQKEKESHSKN